MTYAWKCGRVYGEHDNPKLSEDWLTCRCGKKYHFSCGEVNGVLDDDIPGTNIAILVPGYNYM